MVDVVHNLSTPFVTGYVQVVVGATDHAEPHGAPDFRPCLLLVEFLGVGFEPERGEAITEFKGAHRLDGHHVEQGLDETATFLGFVAPHLGQAVDVLAEAFRVATPHDCPMAGLARLLRVLVSAVFHLGVGGKGMGIFLKWTFRPLAAKQASVIRSKWESI